jgi:serine/threonine-protein kinase
MLTGRRLIEGDSGPAAIPAVLAGEFPRPRDLKPDVPAELERIALKALAGDREVRYASAAAMRQDLEAFALSAGYLLSSSDLADFVREASEKKPTDPPPSEEGEKTAESVPSKIPTTPLSPSPNAPGENAFDALLGAELERLDAAEPFSVFTSGSRGGRISRPSTASIERSSRSSLPRSSTVSIDVEVGEPEVATRPPVETSPSTFVPRPSPARHLLWGVPLALLAIIGAGLIVTRADDPENAPSDPAPAPRDPPPVSLAGDDPAETAELPIGAETPEAPPIAPDPPADPGPVKRGRPDRERPAPTGDATEPPRPPPAAGAQLSVNTDPWSYVYVDGRRVRHTPLLGHALPAGRHTLRFHNPELGLERSQTVDLAPGEHRRISLDLR